MGAKRQLTIAAVIPFSVVFCDPAGAAVYQYVGDNFGVFGATPPTSLPKSLHVLGQRPVDADFYSDAERKGERGRPNKLDLKRRADHAWPK
jgi:hypothetical protein